MKPFAVWLIIAALVFGGMGGAYHFHLDRNPRRILVAIDSSYEMKPLWPELQDRISALGGKRYTSYCLVTEKNIVHTWQPELSPGKIVPYAPRNFDRLTRKVFEEIDQAHEKYLFTDASGEKKADWDGWKVIVLR